MVTSKLVGGLGNNLFQISTALSLALDNNDNLIFDENGMRMHLAECLEDMCFSMFPLKST